MKKTILWIAIVLLILAGGFFAFEKNFFRSDNSWICENGQWVKKGNPVQAQPSGTCGTQSPSPSASATSTPSGNPTENVNIKVNLPAKGQSVSLPIIVNGSARVFENVVSLRLEDKDGTVLYDGTAYANAPDVGQFGNFEGAVDFLAVRPKSSDVTLKVFWNSPADGTELDVISLPLKLDLANLTNVKVFFGKQNSDQDCNRVFAADRFIQKTEGVARRALEVLVHGPTIKESGQGYFTNISNNVVINSLNIENAIARADFNQALQNGVSGSCAVASLHAQIVQTLKQFPTVIDVVVSINGQTEGILQP